MRVLRSLHFNLLHSARPLVIVALFSVATSMIVLASVAWKSYSAYEHTIDRSKIDIQNLTHVVVEHATTNIKTVDVAMGGVVDLLRYREPVAERMNAYLAATAKSIPAIREMGVIDPNGNWKYSSLRTLPDHNNGDRPYFAYHRDNRGLQVRVNEPLTSRITGRTTVVLSRRLESQAGDFLGVLVALIDSDFFYGFYDHFNLGRNAGIALVNTDGRVIAHWPSRTSGRTLADTILFKEKLPQRDQGFFDSTSPYDGIEKYYGYEKAAQYPLVGVVAESKEELLSAWRRDLVSDFAVAVFLLLTVCVLGLVLATQLNHRHNVEAELRRREYRYRLLAENVADVVLLLDRAGRIQYVSQSVTAVLGYDANVLVGRRCTDLVHADDRTGVEEAGRALIATSSAQTVVFRTYREDGTTCWMEYNFKLCRAERADEVDGMVGVLRDVTQRKSAEDELITANQTLSRLATIDALTGLANRRAFDSYLYNDCRGHRMLSVLMIDIDHFKGMNDSLGHSAGDAALKRVADVIMAVTEQTNAFAARYGGEEFVVVLPATDERAAKLVADTIRLSIRELAIVNPKAEQGILTVSVGVSCGSPQVFNPNELVTDADYALYEAKNLGRDRSVMGMLMSGLHAKQSAAAA